jgi:murein DD-endopeptidase MepM/ murein hydrolase activator NlpD
VHATGFPTDNVSVSAALVPLLDPKLNQAETDALSAIYAVNTRPATFPWPFAMPVEDATIVSGYGDYRIYNGGLLTTRHTGVDLRRRIGDPVLATADGRVALAQSLVVR